MFDSNKSIEAPRPGFTTPYTASEYSFTMTSMGGSEQTDALTDSQSQHLPGRRTAKQGLLIEHSLARSIKDAQEHAQDAAALWHKEPTSFVTSRPPARPCSGLHW